MQTKTLRQTVRFKASPQEVYDMLMDSKKHRSLSGEPATISKKVGGKFTAWGSHLSGFNLVLKPGRKIVQAWRGQAGIGLWNDEDNFFYDVLAMPCGSKIPLRLRSMVGLIPLFAVGVVEQKVIEELPELWRKYEAYRALRPDLVQLVSRWDQQSVSGCRLFALTRVFRMTMLLRRMLDESEFLSPFGVRALSRAYLAQPYDFEYNGVHYRVRYEPGESESGLFGGNSNWRGPIWMPVNYMLIENLRRFYQFYGDRLKVECPTGSGNMLTLDKIADELCQRLIKLFRRGADGRRPVFGPYEKFQTDPHFKDYILFHEYFHGDNGRGCGASHQTGWTGLVASLTAQIAEQAPPMLHP